MYILDMYSTVQVVYTACCNDAVNILYCTGIRTAELMFVGHNIYLHDRGQFWPGLEMARTGLSHMLYLTEVYGTKYMPPTKTTFPGPLLTQK